MINSFLKPIFAATIIFAASAAYATVPSQLDTDTQLEKNEIVGLDRIEREAAQVHLQEVRKIRRNCRRGRLVRKC